MRTDILHEIGLDFLTLLTGLSCEIDNFMFLEIAQADYGLDVDDHLYYLKKIRDEQEFRSPFGWCPREVLELIRWSEPEDPEWKPGSTGLRGHLMRAFCCTALLCAASKPENIDYFEGENHTLAQLLVSLKHINNSTYTNKAAKLIAYRLTNFPEEEEEKPFFILSLLLLCLRIHTSKHVISELTIWLLEEESNIRTASWAILPESDEQWLLGLTYFSMRHDKWIEMGEELASLAANLVDEKTKHMVIEISHKLSCYKNW